MIYAKHSVLNLGQALQGLRYLYSHPDIDALAAPGTVKHALRSFGRRSRLVANDLFFAVLPPQTHHTAEELSVFPGIPARRWFQYGYCAWRFTDDGEPRADLTGLDHRWDPRCKASVSSEGKTP